MTSSGSPTSNVELSYSGYEFLTSIFEKYDSDKDKALNSQVRLDRNSLPNFNSSCIIFSGYQSTFVKS